jgi:hypothetical protein
MALLTGLKFQQEVICIPFSFKGFLSSVSCD